MTPDDGEQPGDASPTVTINLTGDTERLNETLRDVVEKFGQLQEAFDPAVDLPQLHMGADLHQQLEEFLAPLNDPNSHLRQTLRQFEELRTEWSSVYEDVVRPALEDHPDFSALLHLPARDFSKLVAAHREEVRRVVEAAATAGAETAPAVASGRIVDRVATPPDAADDRAGPAWVADQVGTEADSAGLTPFQALMILLAVVGAIMNIVTLYRSGQAARDRAQLEALQRETVERLREVQAEVDSWKASDDDSQEDSASAADGPGS